MVSLICCSRAPHEDFPFAYANFAACFTGNVILTVINFAMVSESSEHIFKGLFYQKPVYTMAYGKKKSTFNNKDELLTHPHVSSVTLGSLLAH